MPARRSPCATAPGTFRLRPPWCFRSRVHRASLDDAQAAHSHLGHLAEAATAAGLGEPSVVKFLPDEIEALAVLGEVDLAWSFTRQLEAQGKSLGRPWALATAARCRAASPADGDLGSPGRLRTGAVAASSGLRCRSSWDGPCSSKARSSGEPGTGSGPRTLGHALGIFEHLGAPLWADKAGRELSKIASAPVDGLTETERRVAALVTQGHTNREVAAAMFVTENTVQTHIRHIFQKLGVRSRTELAARLLSAPTNTTEAHGPLDAQKSTEPASLTGLRRARLVVNITDSGDSSASARS